MDIPIIPIIPREGIGPLPALIKGSWRIGKED